MASSIGNQINCRRQCVAVDPRLQHLPPLTQPPQIAVASIKFQIFHSIQEQQYPSWNQRINHGIEKEEDKYLNTKWKKSFKSECVKRFPVCVAESLPKKSYFFLCVFRFEWRSAAFIDKEEEIQNLDRKRSECPGIMCRKSLRLLFKGCAHMYSKCQNKCIIRQMIRKIGLL